MNNLIMYFKSLLIPFFVILFMPVFLSILNIIGFKTNSIVLLCIMCLTSLISALKLGKTIKKKGYLIGLVFGTILSFIMFIISLLFNNNYSFNILFYYLIIMVFSVIGGILGIQNK